MSRSVGRTAGELATAVCCARLGGARLASSNRGPIRLSFSFGV